MHHHAPARGLARRRLAHTEPGERKQQGNTSQMIRGVAAMIEYASSFYTLYPGDIFLSGTPAGVGPMKPGDELVATIEKVGTMRVRVRAA